MDSHDICEVCGFVTPEDCECPETEQATPTTVDSQAAGSVPWVGKLHHASDICDDWGCIRDDDGNRIMTISSQNNDECLLDKHRRDKTDPTLEIIDYLLSKLNVHNA